MFKYLISFLLVLLSFTSAAKEWVSPIDKKYLSKNSELFSKFDQARTLLNSWGGQRLKLQQADNLLQEILEIDPEYAPAHREYGRLYIMAGYIKKDSFREGSLNPSEASILKSLEIEPNYADSYVLLGHLYTKMKRYHEAESALIKAEEIGTKIPWLQLNRAELLQKQKKYKEAMQRYQQVVDQGTSNRKAYARALSGITSMHWYMKDYEKANQGYIKQLEYSPDSAWKWGNYASFLLYTYKDVDGAIDKGRKAIELMDYGMGRFTLSCALYTKWAMLKDNPSTTTQAQKYFDEAWSLYPYPDKVIEKTKKYPFTRITSQALSYLQSKNQ